MTFSLISMLPPIIQLMFIYILIYLKSLSQVSFYFFIKVHVLNFNPYFKKKEMDKHYVIKKYSSQIHVVNFPEDILSSEYEKSSDVRLAEVVSLVCDYLPCRQHLDKSIMFGTKSETIYKFPVQQSLVRLKCSSVVTFPTTMLLKTK